MEKNIIAMGKGGGEYDSLDKSKEYSREAVFSMEGMAIFDDMNSFKCDYLRCLLAY